MPDRIKQAVAANLALRVEAESAERAHDGSVPTSMECRYSLDPASDGPFICPPVCAGYAHREGRASARYTEKQVRYLTWCYERGQANKGDKMLAREAARLMKLHGTAAGARAFPNADYWKVDEGSDGKPTFRRWDWINHWRMKAWFSQTSTNFSSKTTSALKDKNKRQERTTAFGDDDGSDDDGME